MSDAFVSSQVSQAKQLYYKMTENRMPKTGIQTI